jgi:hypothetical protein
MMTRVRRIAWSAALGVLMVGEVAAQEYDPGRLYGRVTTMDGGVYEGFIRWDKNEGHWTDVVDASKRLPSRFFREAAALSGRTYRESDEVRILGFRVSSSSDNWPSSATSTIRLGHVAKLHVLDDEFALVTLRSGEEHELKRSSTDLGSGNRGIFVQPALGASTELKWNDIDFVEFIPAPESASPYGVRLYGTLTTKAGTDFTGWITWDMDEIFGGDVLDGQDGSRDLDVAMGDVAKIERESSSRARVVFKTGDEVVLRGTNDVNSGNRGIAVGDPGLGQVRLDWSDFGSVTFSDPPEAMAYKAFQNQWRLQGTVHSSDGETLTGVIRWDNDEEWSWEMLDGDSGGIEFDVEFAMIASIQRASARSALVTLADGREFEMRNSNDVNEDNKGIFVRTAEGDLAMVRWDDFERVDFTRP